MAKSASLNSNDGVVLALDLGEKRIGVAVSDDTRKIARAAGVIKRSSRKADFSSIARMAERLGATQIVIGLPSLPSSDEGSKASWVRDYAADFARQSGYEVKLWDESLSTVDAEASLRERGVHGKRRRQRVDEVAAAFILQSYLNSQSN